MHRDHYIVYILTNEAMPGYVKIGMSEVGIIERMKTLYNTSVPVPFECYYAAKVEKAKNVEKRLHRAFDKYRVNKNREFFEIEPEAVAEIIQMVAIEDVTPQGDISETPDDIDAIRKLEKRAERFSFAMVGVPNGSKLTLYKYGDMTCEVAGNHEVIFEGEHMTLSAAALKALRTVGFEWKSAQGAAHWCFEGKRLKDLREEMENM
jgi:hypothetical protein